MLGHTKGQLGQSVGQSSVGEFLCRNGLWGSLFVIQSLVLPSIRRFSKENNFRDPWAVHNFLGLCFYAGRQITHGGQVQRPICFPGFSSPLKKNGGWALLKASFGVTNPEPSYSIVARLLP